MSKHILQQTAANALSVRAVCHNEHASLRSVETHNIVTPALIMPFFEESFTVPPPIEAPTKSVAEPNRTVVVVSSERVGNSCFEIISAVTASLEPTC
jgi:hypothetical protein